MRLPYLGSPIHSLHLRLVAAKHFSEVPLHVPGSVLETRARPSQQGFEGDSSLCIEVEAYQTQIHGYVLRPHISLRRLLFLATKTQDANNENHRGSGLGGGALRISFDLQKLQAVMVVADTPCFCGFSDCPPWQLSFGAAFKPTYPPINQHGSSKSQEDFYGSLV